MAESAYHQEARRRQRVLERKHEALRKLTEKGLEDSENPVDADGKRKTPILFTGSGNFETHRSVYPWFGSQRDKRQYDHSRNGPLLPPTWHALRRELYNIGQGTPLLSGDQSYPTSFQDLQQVRVVTARK